MLWEWLESVLRKGKSSSFSYTFDPSSESIVLQTSARTSILIPNVIPGMQAKGGTPNSYIL